MRRLYRVYIHSLKRVVPIKYFFKCTCFVLLFFSLLTSCDKTTVGKPTLQADLKNVTDVQLTYRQNVYNVKLSYGSEFLTVSFTDDATCLHGVTYTVNSAVCKISYGDISHTVPVGSFPEAFLPVVIYEFVSEFGGIVSTEKFNPRQNCSYVSRNIRNCSVTFEIYRNGENISYSLHIS